MAGRDHPNQLVFSFCSDPVFLAGEINFIEGICTRSRKGRAFYVPAEKANPAANHVLSRVADLPNPVHVLLGQSVTPDRAPERLRVVIGKALWLSTHWPRCPYCRANIVYCTGCGHVFCATRVHEVSGRTYDEDRHTVEFCHLCP